MTKKEAFRRLVEDVANCHICEKLVTLPHVHNSEYLENDDHGLSTEHPYINRWNLWQGGLDADIMIIGQDYGTKEDGNAFEVCNYTDTANPTDNRLKQLFKCTFGIDINSKDERLFFTNMANCYRHRKTSGGMHSAWLPICANKFMSRLIEIIRPKTIIVLGRAAFEALYCMENLKIVCLDSVNGGKDNYSEIISRRYQIDLDGAKINVFPVFHPGSNSKINRSEEQQIKDWKRIAEHHEWRNRTDDK